MREIWLLLSIMMASFPLARVTGAKKKEVEGRMKLSNLPLSTDGIYIHQGQGLPKVVWPPGTWPEEGLEDMSDLPPSPPPANVLPIMTTKLDTIIEAIADLRSFLGKKLDKIREQPSQGCNHSQSVAPTKAPTIANAKEVFECGQTRQNVVSLKNRVFGGNRTCEDCIPWQVAMMFRYTNGTLVKYCGGTIIHPRFILTAAHCTETPPKGDGTIHQIPAERLVIIAGVNDLKDESGMNHDVKAVHDHPNFVRNAHFDFPDYDFSLLELIDPLDLTEGSRAKAACLPTVEDLATFKDGQTKLVVSGWGKGDKNINIMRMADVPWVSDTTCKFSWIQDPDLKRNISLVNINKVISPRVLCAGNPDLKDLVGPCLGDSGGPLTWKDPVSSRVKVVGVVSFMAGDENDGICKPGFPSGYSKIPSYEILGWIMMTMK